MSNIIQRAKFQQSSTKSCVFLTVWIHLERVSRSRVYNIFRLSWKEHLPLFCWFFWTAIPSRQKKRDLIETLAAARSTSAQIITQTLKEMTLNICLKSVPSFFYIFFMRVEKSLGFWEGQLDNLTLDLRNGFNMWCQCGKTPSFCTTSHQLRVCQHLRSVRTVSTLYKQRLFFG